MGQSTDGQLCYGIAFPEGFEFPWMEEDEDGDIVGDEEDWWLKENGYKPPFELYDKNGEYAPGIKTKRVMGHVEAEDEKLVNSYYEHKREFKDQHPFPVEVINYCSGDCPMYILAIKGTFTRNSRGYPEVIDPAALKVTDEQKQVLIDFCKKYLQEKIDEHNGDYHDDKIELEPKWLLSSCWN